MSHKKRCWAAFQFKETILVGRFEQTRYSLLMQACTRHVLSCGTPRQFRWSVWHQSWTPYMGRIGISRAWDCASTQTALNLGFSWPNAMLPSLRYGPWNSAWSILSLGLNTCTLSWQMCHQSNQSALLPWAKDIHAYIPSMSIKHLSQQDNCKAYIPTAPL